MLIPQKSPYKKWTFLFYFQKKNDRISIMKNIDKTNNNLEKIENCIDLAEKTDMIVYSKQFFPISQLNKLKHHELNFSFKGLNEDCEKKLLAVYPKDFTEEDLFFPVKYFKIEKKSKFIKQCKNTRDSSTRRVLVMRHVLVGYELHEDFSKHIGKLVCRHGAKPCNKETELLGTLKASITTT